MYQFVVEDEVISKVLLGKKCWAEKCGLWAIANEQRRDRLRVSLSRRCSFASDRGGGSI